MNTSKSKFAVIVTVIVIFLGCVGVIIYNFIKHDTDVTSIKPFVCPPIAGVDVPDTNLQIDATLGGVFTLPSGSIIEVPANAFIDAEGNMITGVVNLKYREFKNPTDFFVSGIPMTYDSAGTQYTFESAGMFDLTGFAKGTPIKIADNKNVNVKMATTYKEDKYNKYYLDTINKTWMPIGKNILEKAENKSSLIKVKVKGNAAKLQSNLPANFTLIKPVKATPENNTIIVKADPKEFPELSIYKDVAFEISKEQYKNLKVNFSNTRFNNVKLFKSKRAGNYDFELTKISKSKDTQVYYLKNCLPVFKEKDYEQAMEIYNKLYSQYHDAYQEKLVAAAIEEKKKEDADAIQLKQIEEWRKQSMVREIQSVGYNVFAVRKFGTYNCDCPNFMPVGVIVQAGVTDEKGETISHNTLYMVDHNRNSIYAIYPVNGKSTLRYDPKSQTTFWVVTNEGKIAMIEPADVKKLNPPKVGTNPITLAMHISEKQLTTKAEISEFLKMN